MERLFAQHFQRLTPVDVAAYESVERLERERPSLSHAQLLSIVGRTEHGRILATRVGAPLARSVSMPALDGSPPAPPQAPPQAPRVPLRAGAGASIGVPVAPSAHAPRAPALLRASTNMGSRSVVTSSSASAPASLHSSAICIAP